MKLSFENGYSYIENGILDMKNLIIKPQSSLLIYTSSFTIEIQKDPIIKLRKIQIEGYQAIIKNNKMQNKKNVTKANRIIIDFLENRIYTFENRGTW